MRTNTAKAKLRAGEVVNGCFTRYPEPGIVEVLGYQGWDFLVFDGEHGTIDPRDCENMTRAAELREVTSMVRVTTNQPPTLLRYLDTGVQGVQVPWVNTAEEAERAVKSVKYHPLGIRGLAGVRAANYGQTYPMTEYVGRANDETLVVLQIESREGVANLDAILAVPGIDVVFIGPMDLSQSFGYPGQPGHPDVQKVMQRITEATQSAGLALGILVPTIDAAKDWKGRGAKYLLTTIEAMLRNSSRAYLDAVRS